MSVHPSQWVRTYLFWEINQPKLLGSSHTTMATIRARELYNDIAFDYSAIKTNEFKRWIEETTVLQAILHNGVKDKSVLDLGCGSGHFCRILQKHGAKTVCGVDVSDEMIQEAQRIENSTPLGIEYHRIDLLEHESCDLLQMLGGAMDLCASAYLFPYASNAEDLRKFCRAAANALCSGGKFVSVTTVLTETMQNATTGGILESKPWGFSIVWTTESATDGMMADVTLLGEGRTNRVTFPNFFWSKTTITQALLDSGFANVEWLGHKVYESAPSNVQTEFQNEDSALDAVGYFVATKQ